MVPPTLRLRFLRRVYATLPSDGHSIFDRLQPTSPVAVGTEDRPEKDDDPILDCLSHSLSSLSGGFWENLVTKLKPDSENALFIVRGSFLACFLTVL